MNRPLTLALIFISPAAWAASPTIVSPITVSTTTVTVSTTTVSATTLTSATTATPAPFIIGNQPRTLDATFSLAARHPQITSSQARIDEARGFVRSAKGSRWFTVSGDAEAGVQHYDDEGITGSEGVGNVGLSLNQPLIDGGRRRGVVLSAEERFAGATNNYEWQQRLRRYAAAQAHINLWLAQELVQNNADNVSQLEAIVTEISGRLNQKEATITEMAEAQSRLAAARALQAERIAALGNAQAAYLRDVGESVSTVANPGRGIPEATGTPAEHPLIAAARHAVDEASGVVQQRSAAYWPTLDLRGRASHNGFSGTSRTEQASQGQLTLNLGYTFIDHGVTAGETAAARAGRRAAEANLADTKLQIESARFNAQSNLTEADRRVAESDRARTESDRVIKNLGQEVRQGNRTVRDLLDARRDQLAAANAYTQAFANRTLVTYDLERWQ